MEHIAVLTSGGDSPGMNPAVRAVTRTALDAGLKVTGIMRGYQGLIERDFVELSSRYVGGIINQGGTILKSARCKEFYQDQGVALGAESIRDSHIDGLVVIGGDGSFRGARKLAENHGVTVVGAPGTIDNDIAGTDFTIGFDTAAATALDAIDKIRDTATSHDRLFIVEVMGRHSGELALTVALAGGAEDVVVPETATDLDMICENLNDMKRLGKKSSIIVYAEGDEFGSSIQFGRQIEQRTDYTVRVSVLGHMQRGGAPTVNDRILGTRLGAACVQFLMEGKSNCMAGVRDGQVVSVPLKDAADEKKPFRSDLVELCRAMAT